MVRKFSLLLFLFSISLFSQDEKRLALVIGNSNYDKGELKNPVNDARLIASTLDSLDFDVILKENLENRSDFIQSIREFGNKRSEYDVAFVYYAGHGIQVDDENFLLPTKQDFSSEEDVLDFGVSVQNIMRYIRAQTNEVNILILDACRDNPFESKWNTTRSLKSQGLAKIPPPTGSLIAFSTDSGQTAPDGDGENSVYTVSLAKNMLLKDTSIDQVFRNVRAEVLAQTDGAQRPVESTQLTGQTFYLIGRSIEYYENQFIDSLDSDNYENTLSITYKMVEDYGDNFLSHLLHGHSNSLNKNYELAIKSYEKSLEIKNNPGAIFSYVDDEELGILSALENHSFKGLEENEKMVEIWDKYISHDDFFWTPVGLFLGSIFHSFKGSLNGAPTIKIYLEYFNLLFSKNEGLHTLEWHNGEMREFKNNKQDLELLISYSSEANVNDLHEKAQFELIQSMIFLKEYQEALLKINLGLNNKAFQSFLTSILIWKLNLILEMKDYDQALKLLDKIFDGEFNVNYEDFHFEASQVYYSIGDYESAIKSVEKYSDHLKSSYKTNDNWDNYFSNFTPAILYYLVGDTLKAYEYITMAYQIDESQGGIGKANNLSPFLKSLILVKLGDSSLICQDIYIKKMVENIKWQQEFEFDQFATFSYGNESIWRDDFKNMVDYYNKICQ